MFSPVRLSEIELSTHNTIFKIMLELPANLLKARLRNKWQIKKEDRKNVTAFLSICKCMIVYIENSKTSELLFLLL